MVEEVSLQVSEPYRRTDWRCCWKYGFWWMSVDL